MTTINIVIARTIHGRSIHPPTRRNQSICRINPAPINDTATSPYPATAVRKVLLETLRTARDSTASVGESYLLHLALIIRHLPAGHRAGRVSDGLVQRVDSEQPPFQ